MSARVIGIDPGPTPGIVVLHTEDHRLVDVDVLQCSANTLWSVLAVVHGVSADVLAVERFVSRGRASAEQRLTGDQVAQLQQLHHGAVLRSASEVKPWATDTRLDAAGLLEATKGMRHAKDAARHALYAAVKADLLADPLSRRTS